jgi:hypothetical protein
LCINSTFFYPFFSVGHLGVSILHVVSNAAINVGVQVLL